jgi:hypothetical protein
MLMLPELGYEVEARPGDMVFFLANHQLHKLDIDRSTLDPTQIVLTWWTSDGAMELANPVSVQLLVCSTKLSLCVLVFLVKICPFTLQEWIEALVIKLFFVHFLLFTKGCKCRIVP